MTRLPLILCIVALLGSAVSAALFFHIGNSKQVLASRLADAQQRAGKLEADLAAANERSGGLQDRLRTADHALDQARLKLEASEARAAAGERDLAQTKNVLAVYELTARALADEITALRQDLSDTRATHAPPETVAAYKSAIAELEKQLATARAGTAAPGAAAASTAVFTNRAGRATILTVGPENAFVVLNFGSARGAKLGQKLAVSQGTSDVATVQISDVRAHYSIAQVLTDSLRGVLQKGDSATLIR